MQSTEHRGTQVHLSPNWIAAGPLPNRMHRSGIGGKSSGLKQMADFSLAEYPEISQHVKDAIAASPKIIELPGLGSGRYGPEAEPLPS